MPARWARSHERTVDDEATSKVTGRKRASQVALSATGRSSSSSSSSESDQAPPRTKVRLTHQKEPVPQRNPPRQHLLSLPAELREAIWIHAVTEWQPSTAPSLVLRKKPIRLDRLNRPWPPGLTRVSRQLRDETLQLYYAHNVFECWRPLLLARDWRLSTFGDWLSALGPARIKWLRAVVLLYKHENELEHDVVAALADEGIVLDEAVVTERLELSEYEACFESLGLPRHFGRRRVWDRWMAGGAL